MGETTLICLPFAGAGAAFFRPWQRQAPQGLRILPVQLPGREERFVEPPHTDAAQATDEACALVTGHLAAGAPVAVFGHSMGAVLAYELAHRLEAAAGVRLERLFVSGSPGPWSGRTEWVGDLPEEQFLAKVRVIAGYAHAALDDPEMRELLLPTLRADVRLHESYRPTSDRRLRTPISALRGRQDGLVSAAQITQWAEATAGGLRTSELDGGHMYLTEQPGQLLDLIAAELRTVEVG
ncbi:alpha/beta fold hydrolase [Micromonospora sp. NPDC047187]|uniref:thioesterase II family protein n=1 Tax=Micromonospora sp. NPDC047187 TaxID=3155262 RepID=UPI0033F6D749